MATCGNEGIYFENDARCSIESRVTDELKARPAFLAAVSVVVQVTTLTCSISAGVSRSDTTWERNNLGKIHVIRWYLRSKATAVIGTWNICRADMLLLTSDL